MGIHNPSLLLEDIFCSHLVEKTLNYTVELMVEADVNWYTYID